MSNFIKEWTSKEVENLNRSFRRYSVFVIILKFILPLTALAMAVTLFVYPMLSDSKKKIVLIAQEAQDVKPKESAVMTSPKFVGVDSKNQPYQISAKRAVQESVNVVNLEEITADITLLGDKWVSLVSQKGRYDMTSGLVNLYGDVNLFYTAKGGETTHITAEDAEIKVKDGVMSSQKPVRIESTGIKFTAQNFVLDKQNDKITFQGGVKLIIVK